MTKVEKNWLEWLVFGTGLVLILLVTGYLAYDAVTLGNEPPVIGVELGTVEPRGETYIIPVTLHNQGDETAENIVVEVTLMNGDQEIETAEVSIDFLPRQSTRSGWVTFTTDPATVDDVSPQVLGYQAP